MPETPQPTARYLTVSVCLEFTTKPGELIENYLALSPRQLVDAIFDLPADSRNDLAFALKAINLTIDNAFIVF